MTSCDGLFFQHFEILWLRLDIGAMLLHNYFALKMEAARLTNQHITAQCHHSSI
jgi:hypothetical protein